MLRVETLDEAETAAKAGVFAVEIEMVPHSITQAIAENTGLFLIPTGAGPAQYLCSEDVLGQNRGPVPRHAKVYANLTAGQDRLQGMRIRPTIPRPSTWSTVGMRW